MPRHQDMKVTHFDVSNIIYHKFSHGAISYTLNGENVNVMLELLLMLIKVNGYTVRGSNSAILTHCIRVDSSTVICWTCPFVILWMSGYFVAFILFFMENPVSKRCRL